MTLYTISLLKTLSLSHLLLLFLFQFFLPSHMCIKLGGGDLIIIYTLDI